MTSPAFRPTHVVPQDGLPAWETPDPSRPTVALDALLPVQLVDRLGDWGRVVCANGWSAWVDGRLLIGVPQVPPDASGPPARTADPRPLLARMEEALTGYRRAAEELAAGQTDGEAFRARTQGRRIGVVVDGESMWLYDGAHERWVYCDGARLSTFAAERTPTTSPPIPPEPAREPRHASPGTGDPPRTGPRAGDRTPGGERDQGRDPEARRATGRQPAPEPVADANREPDRNQSREPEPTRLVGEEAEPTRLMGEESESASGGQRDREPDREQGREQGREPEPAGLVGREPGSERSRDREAEPTRLVGEEAESASDGYRDREPDREQGREPEAAGLVGREPESDRSQDREPEARRLVDQEAEPAPNGYRDQGPDPEPTRRADRGEPERAQGDDRGAGRVRAADRERDRRIREREEETRAVPDAAPGGHEPTRVVTFDDDGGRP
ncbi:hypothetical protein [Streptomyces sp. NPDC048508]|uniref:hypothetical protein n=1 Tax=Streptomyces sp. NPDC048508 TaxID=3365561 RepID=UPI003724C110